ncbi:MAG TPA: lysophospholipid acyltransferase family protein, partial [Thermoleophilaceae bacterium]|nr:lysophospholipid acyltransferase family protein [Thermoleophilaceae bacterium]
MNSIVYWAIRLWLKPLILAYFRLSRRGQAHVPEGAVILASNHRSFLDPFAMGTGIPRPIYFMAKSELFGIRPVAWLLNSLGAFPVERGQSDDESTKTALALLERGEVVVIFPEGTRITRGSLGRPRRGVGRLALQSG